MYCNFQLMINVIENSKRFASIPVISMILGLESYMQRFLCLVYLACAPVSSKIIKVYDVLQDNEGDFTRGTLFCVSHLIIYFC